ncbi:hypothetical protein Q4603_20425 [Zobellia galactanivorans]|uniref:hypothetical protein n=1 Tax=Zobellia galactanivorans (strain DSM 12802 / CCUG 47099 / CIP 106680 / NCIMB 13871 / Dsij) TaxID=63186 RepID=UPI0026E18E99|nr:hypothetical protein [Zobellia galactanivorans]MDO6810998.1 hypothetical protein [Zobellia galactanivorans]
MSNDSNRKEVYFKSGLDITMSVVAFIPVVGWAISGTYFIADAFGAFGDFGQPSGISQEEYNKNALQEIKVMHGKGIKSLKFQIDYVPPVENEIIDLYREERQVKIDNTYVAPSVNIQKMKF